MTLDEISKKIHNRLANAEKLYGYVMARQKDDIHSQINLKKQLEVLAEEKAKALDSYDHDIDRKEWEEANREHKEILTAISMIDNSITKMQLNLIEEDMQDESIYEK